MGAALEHWFAPWAKVYGDSKVLSTGLAFLHLAALVWGGGRAVTADGLALRAPSIDSFRKSGQLAFLQSSHRDVLVGLTAAAITGALMFTADLKTYLPSPLYWTKMAVIAVLLVNGALIRRFESGLTLAGDSGPLAWRRTRRHAVVSLVLWFAAVLLGKSLVNA